MSAPESMQSLSPGAEALTEVMSYYKHEMTGLEVAAWWRLLDEFGDNAIVAFVQMHMQISTFRPVLAEALKFLDPSSRNPTAAYEELARTVRSCGPYQAPVFNDAAMARAVVLLGGWLTVNQQMPAQDGNFESSAYMKRFDAMYAQAISDVMLKRSVDAKLCGLHDLSNKPALIESSGRTGSAVATLGGVESAARERDRA